MSLTRLRWLHYGLILLLLLAVAATGFLLQRHRLQWDVSLNAQNSLNPASEQALKSLPGEVTISAYATRSDPKFGDIRKIIRQFFAPYQRSKSDLFLKFIDPEQQPEQARKAGVQVNGEMVISYQNREEHLTALNEQTVTNLLIRLARGRERLVLYLDGHGERRLDGVANHDFGEFGAQLMRKGFRSNSVNLAIAQDMPSNASVLIIASPQTDLLPGEIAKLKNYIERGGNLLWLIDQEPLHGLQPLVEQLGLILTPGVVIDPAAQDLGVPITWALGPPGGIHLVTRNLGANMVFPFARQVALSDQKSWHGDNLIEVAQRGWLETGRLDAPLIFDPVRDSKGPTSIAVALQRTVEDKTQRIIVFGNAHFLSNTYIGNGGNLDLGLSMINWLAGDDNLTAIAPRSAKDNSLVLSRRNATGITLTFLFGLPLAFFVAGAIIRWRRNRR